MTREIPPELTPRFLANEFLEDDVNRFRHLARRRVPVDWLDRATGNDRAGSVRYREIMAPLGLGDDLRAAFRSGGECWGFLCLHREDATRGFTEAGARLVGRLSTHVGEGLRRALLVATADESGDADVDGPGEFLLSQDRTLVATTAAADRWLWELSDPNQRSSPLPIAVEAVLARLEAIRSGSDEINVPAKVRVRTRSGRWAVLHASDMAGLGEGRHVAVVVERASRPSWHRSSSSPTGSPRGKPKSHDSPSRAGRPRWWRANCASRKTRLRTISRRSSERSAWAAAGS